MAELLGPITRLKLTREHVVMLAVLVALALLVMPLPGVVLDALFAANLALAVAVLILAASAASVERFASLPVVMVTASLLRVGLCLGALRAITTGGAAGSLAQSLGMQMTGGGSQILSAVVLLALLVIVTFIVINLGVMRLAEVAARFALDAMPGKQMALEAALSAGRLAPEVGAAEARRMEAQQSFFGAMDGVARFLKGDAIAIVAITVGIPLAGMANGMPVADQAIPALGQATILMISAILMGAAAALLLARTAEQPEGGPFLRELVARPALIGAVAMALLLVGLAPGIAKAPLLLSAALVGACGLYLHRAQWSQPPPPEEQPAGQLELRLGLGLIGLVAGHDLPGLLAKTRGALSDELGFAVPPFAVTDEQGLQGNSFRIVLGGSTVTEATLRPGRLLVAPVAEAVLPGGGLETALPDGAQATWLRDTDAQPLDAASYHVLDPLAVLVLHVRAAVTSHAAELFDLQRATELLQMAEVTHPATVAAVRQAGVTLSDVREVGRCLLAEGVPLTERISLLEALATAQGRTAADLAEAARPALAQTITRLVAPGGFVEVVELARELEQELATAVDRSGLPLTLAPQRAAPWLAMLRQLAERLGAPGRPATILCTARTRGAVAQLIAESGAALRAVQAAELLPLTEVHTIHTAQAPMADPVATVIKEGAI
ncbi:MAG: FHIPEP family type III secretion protein [Armatimonadia bacterium]